MSTSVKAGDWQVCGLGQAVGAVVLGGGWFLFAFYSPSINSGAFFLFSGIGIGEGGNLSGTVNPGDYGAISSPWSSMSNIPLWCSYQKFSIDDLAATSGRIASASASIDVVGYSATYITAGDNFSNQSVGGLSYGPSANAGYGTGAFELVGGWTYAGVSPLHP